MLFRTIYWSTLVLTLIISSCQAPEAYRKAAEAFSQGAELETRAFFSEGNRAIPDEMITLDTFYRASAPADKNKTAQEYYRNALQQIDKALGGAAQLKKNNMLDNALTIKSLTSWRMDQYEQALANAAEAESLLINDRDGKEDVRDFAIVQAMPGLVNMDIAYSALEECMQRRKEVTNAIDTSATVRQQLYTEIKAYYTQSVINDADGAHSVKRGLALIERAADQVGQNNKEMKLYLLNAQLAGLDTWGDLRVEVRNASRRLTVSEFFPNEKKWLEDEKANYDALVDEYLERLANQVEGGERSSLYLYWKSILKGA